MEIRGIPENAGKALLVQAIAANHRELFFAVARARGGTIRKSAGLSWTREGPGPGAGSMIPFPDFGDPGFVVALDALMRDYREDFPAAAQCWSLDPIDGKDTEINLFSRGFRPGRRPCWMALDLDHLPVAPEVPGNLEIRADLELDLSGLDCLPFASDCLEPWDRAYPFQQGNYQRFLGFIGGAVAGQVVVFLTEGVRGLAGIYNLGVLPGLRKQGIGGALLNEALSFGKKMGYAYAGINATQEGFYEKRGFYRIAAGWTWSLNLKGLHLYGSESPYHNLIEAIGKGDLEYLEGKGYPDRILKGPFPNGMSLMEVAAYFSKPASATWLLEKGMSITPLQAWDLGWKS